MLNMIGCGISVLDLPREWKPSSEPQKLCEKEVIKSPREIPPMPRSPPWREPSKAPGVIVDPLAYYVPYHVNPKGWGIYLREYKIKQDFMSFINKYWLFIVEPIRSVLSMLYFYSDIITFVYYTYLSVILIHELQHHIIEDTSTLSHANYPLLIKKDEESFCEYYAFWSVDKNFLTWPRRRYLELISLEAFSRRLLRQFPKKIKRAHYHINSSVLSSLKTTIPRILSALYFHWNRGSNPIYRPCLTTKMLKFLQNNYIWYISEALNITQHHLGRLLSAPTPQTSIRWIELLAPNTLFKFMDERIPVYRTRA